MKKHVLTAALIVGEICMLSSLSWSRPKDQQEQWQYVEPVQECVSVAKEDRGGYPERYVWTFKNTCSQPIAISVVTPDPRFGISLPYIAARQYVFQSAPIYTDMPFKFFACPAQAVSLDNETKQVVTYKTASFVCKK